MIRPFAGLLGLLLVLRSTAFGGELPPQPAGASGVDSSLPRPADDAWGFTGYPIIFWTPETSLMLGGGVVLYRKADDRDLRQDETSLEAMGTWSKGFEANLEQTLYFRGNDYRLSVLFKPSRAPDRSFFGIGADTPDSMEEKMLLLQVPLGASLQYQIFKSFFLGPAVNVSSYSVKSRSEHGILIQDTVAGSAGTFAVGAGLAACWDTTDNPFFPQSGFKVSVTGLFFRKEYGSRDNFAQVQIDHRHYFKLARDQVLALQGVHTLSTGTVPWEMLPALGGAAMLRGFYEGRYRDKEYAAVQAEYRFPVWWRFGGAVFAAMGEVARDVTAFNLKNLKGAGGAGLRILMDRDEHINLRMDGAFTHRGDFEFYISLLEAY